MPVWKRCFCASFAGLLLTLSLVACGGPVEEKQAQQSAPAEEAPRKHYTDELHQRHTWLRLLWVEQYAELEKTIVEAYAQRAQGTISSNTLRGRFWQLQYADAAFAPKLDAWVAQENSPHAYLARGLNLLQRADNLRGSGPARSVPPEVMAQVKTLAQLGVADLEKSLELDARCAMCIGGKIWAAYFLGVSDPTLVDKALAIDPTLGQPVRAHFGLLYPEWGGSEAQMLAFIQKMEASSDTAKFVPRLHSLVELRRGLALQAQGKDIPAAIAAYEAAIAHYPDSDALKNVAELYLRQGQAGKAAKALDQNLEQDPWDLYTIEALAQAYFGLGESAKGKAMLEKRNELITRYRNGE